MRTPKLRSLLHHPRRMFPPPEMALSKSLFQDILPLTLVGSIACATIRASNLNQLS